MSQSDGPNSEAMCPRCGAVMVHVAMTPHPVARNMQRNTYVCFPCNRTRTYMLPVALVEVPLDGAVSLQRA